MELIILFVIAILSLLFTAYLAREVSEQKAGSERMQEIAGYIREGAITQCKIRYAT